MAQRNGANMDKRAITMDPATGRLMLDGQLLD